MKRSIGLLLGLTLAAGAGLAQAGRGGGHAGGGHAATGARPAPSGGFTRFTTGPMHFTTGSMHFTTGPHPRPPIAVRPVPPGFRPVHPIHGPAFVGTVVVGAPFFWYPPYPYPYAYYPYAAPAYGGPAYTEAPQYIEQSDIRYYCPDYQDYYPNVTSCPSPWMQVVPGAAPATPD
ncbi:MAG TPA: hypothetical protein VJO54_06535 [Burkholderiales bacterium]|nr:hypothetical protein [Burkholderiales bacterium]